MKSFKFKKIDAFATVNSSGNPAGYIWLDSKNDISEIEMLQIAKELKTFVNEVGFIYKSSENIFVLRYFSSVKEVEFCGHATVAILYDLIKNNTELLNFSSIIIKTNKGILIVENKILKEDAVFIQSPEPFFKSTKPSIKTIAENLKIKFDVIDSSKPISIINAGLSTLLIPIKSLENILEINPDISELNNFCIQSEIDIIEVFTTDVFNKNNHYRTRVFAPTFGYLEDPATGSGNSALGYYLIDNNLWESEIICIEQNGLKEKFNHIKLQKKTDENNKIRVWFGGGAITRIVGEYILTDR